MWARRLQFLTHSKAVCKSSNQIQHHRDTKCGFRHLVASRACMRCTFNISSVNCCNDNRLKGFKGPMICSAIDGNKELNDKESMIMSNESDRHSLLRIEVYALILFAHHKTLFLVSPSKTHKVSKTDRQRCTVITAQYNPSVSFSFCLHTHTHTHQWIQHESTMKSQHQALQPLCHPSCCLCSTVPRINTHSDTPACTSTAYVTRILLRLYNDRRC